MDLFAAAWDRKVFARGGDRDTWMAASIRAYETLDGSMDIELADGRWVQFVNRPLPDGSTLNVVRDITLQKRQEQAARRDAEAFREMALSFADWFWQTDTEHRFVTPSTAAANFPGELDNFTGRTRWDVVGADVENDPVWRAHVRTLNEHRPFRDFRYEHVSSSGLPRRSRISGTPFFDEAGNFAGYRGVGIDETRIAEADQLANLTQQAIDRLSEGVAVHDADGNLQLWNRAFEEIYAASPLDLRQGMSFEAVVRELAGSGLVDTGERDAEAWVRHRLSLPRPNPEPGERRIDGRWYQIRESLTNSGGMAILMNDIDQLKRQQTELLNARSSLEARVEERTRSLERAVKQARTEARQRSAAETLMRESEFKFRAIAEGANQGLSVYNGAEPMFVNRALADMLGYADETELKAAGSVEDYYLPDDLEQLRQWGDLRRLGGEAPDRYELQLRRKDGSTFWVEQSVAVIPWEGLQAFLCAVVDIDDQKQLTQQLRRATQAAERANEAKSQFLAKMSHELRTPLNAIIGFSEMISNQVLGPVGTGKYVIYSEDIVRSGRHLLELINDLLDLSKIEAGAVELDLVDVDLRRAVDDCIELMSPLAEGSGIELVNAVPEGPLNIRADRRSFKQVLINLMSNAVKFNRPGGRVRVAAERLGTACRISVSDDGVGIDKADMEVLFRPFGQIPNQMLAEQKGTGLGLPIVRGLVELHGGTVGVRSRPGEGTTVIITLPGA